MSFATLFRTFGTRLKRLIDGGRFSIADCLYGPVAFRFRTYGVAVDGVARAYLDALLAHPLMQQWEQAALAETTIIEADEPRLLYRDKIAAAPAAPRPAS